MVAYSFQPRFEEPIRSGRKRQTIRAERKRHARPGEELQLYVGMRTRHCRLIGRATCLSVTPVRFQLRNRLVQVGFTVLFAAEAEVFARDDGFGSLDDMAGFWADHHPGVDVFDGVLIRWEAKA